MSFASQCEKLASYSDLINDEIKHAIRFIKDTPDMDEEQSTMIAKSFAAGISQLALLKTPLLLESLRVETTASATKELEF